MAPCKLSPLTCGSEPAETTTVAAWAAPTEDRISTTRGQHPFGRTLVQIRVIRFIGHLLFVSDFEPSHLYRNLRR